MRSKDFTPKEKYSKSTAFRFKDGALLMQRVGSISAVKQLHKEGYVAPPECKRGMWAFPYPAFDAFFVSHKLEPLLPKRLRTEYLYAKIAEMHESGMEHNDPAIRDFVETFWKEREPFAAREKKKMRPKKFWWSKPIFSRIALQGESGKDWYLWTDLKAWAKAANASMPHQMDPKSGAWMTYSKDHLEVFLPEKACITKQGIKAKF